MSILTVEVQVVRAQHFTVTEDSLTVNLDDGRTLTVPLGWYPRLFHGTSEERNNWRLIGKGEAIHSFDVLVQEMYNLVRLDRR